MDLRQKELVLLVLVFLFVSFLPRMNTGMEETSDGDVRALTAFFYRDLLFHVLEKGPADIKDFSVEYMAKYKAFGGMRYYPPIQTLLMASSSAIFGKSSFSIRLVPLLEGLGTVILVFFLALKLFQSRKIALISGLVLAINPIFSFFSFLGGVDIGEAFFITLALFFLVSFLDENKKILFYASMAAFALAVSTKELAILFSPVFLLAIKRLDKKTMLIGLSIIVLVMIPYILMQTFFLFSNLSGLEERAGLFTDMGALIPRANPLNAISEREVLGGAVNYKLSILEKLIMGLTTISAPFFIFLPFFFIGVFQARNQKLLRHSFLLFFIPSFIAFTTIFHTESRYFIPLIPISALFIGAGLHTFKPQILAIIFTGALIYSSLFVVAANEVHSGDVWMKSVTQIVKENTEASSIISFRSRMTSFWLEQLDKEGKLYTFEFPYNIEQEKDRLQILELQLSTKSGCVPAHKETYQKFNLCHPPINWVIIEARWEDNAKFPNLRNMLSNNNFELVHEFSGPGKDQTVEVWKRTR